FAKEAATTTCIFIPAGFAREVIAATYELIVAVFNISFAKFSTTSIDNISFALLIPTLDKLDVLFSVM
ncbi:15508_t:CDS:1, partial [Dentiscutata erythropus]